MIAELATLFGVMLVAILTGVPVFFSMAIGVVVFAVAFAPLMSPLVVVQTFQQGLDNQAFTAIPYFFLAGTIMNVGGMSARLLRLARAMIAHIRGGLSHANIAASIVFAGISGSAVADAAAVGSVMIPAMKRDGYSPSYAAAVTAASATIGLVIPPSIPMVIFALFTGASVGSLFLAGIVPGLLMGVFLMAASYIIARRRRYPASKWRGIGELIAAFRASFLALLMPILVIVGLVGGFATTSEIGAVAALYATIVSTLIYREANLKQLFRGVVQAALDAARVLIIIGVSGAFIWIVARLSVANNLALFLLDMQFGPTTILALIALGLIIAGTILEPVTILVVLVPMLVPAALASGIDITHLGIVVVLSTSIGLITPPVGILLYITAAQAQAPALQVVRETMPFLLALLVLLTTIVLVPAVTLWLPG